MSKYTTEVRFICETKSGFTEAELQTKSVDEIINASRNKIFNFDYPIYESNHKPVLETKILKHYYTREIAGETVGLWQLWLNERLNLIMPKYNKLYKAEQSILDKELKNIDVRSESLRTDDLLKEDDYTRTDNLHEAHDATRTDNLHEAHDGTRTDNLHEAHDSTRTDNLHEAHDGTRTDNLHEEFDSTRTDNLTHTNSHNDLNTRKFSDTPQGSITFSEANEEYYWLTDYTEENNTGGATDTNTGTQRNAGSTDNTGTQRNAGTVDNTGTQRNAGTVDNTGTQRNAGTIDNTGTQRNAGTVDNTGTQRNAGSTANTGTQEMENEEFGYRGSRVYAELLEAYNQKIVNIDMLIVNELKDLFFKLW